MLKKIPERAILPDFSKNAVIAYWELSTGSSIAIDSLPQRLQSFKSHII
jgi:hypothetical protein